MGKFKNKKLKYGFTKKSLAEGKVFTLFVADMFDVLPMDKTVQIGTNVTFNCMLKDNGVETWQYKLLNSTRLQIVSSLLNNESAIL